MSRRHSNFPRRSGFRGRITRSDIASEVQKLRKMRKEAEKGERELSRMLEQFRNQKMSRESKKLLEEALGS